VAAQWRDGELVVRGLHTLHALWFAFSLLVVVGMSETASACSARASYRSVILNTVPDKLPPDASLYRVRFEEALFDADRNEIQGVRGFLLETDGQLPINAKIEIMGRLPFCDTWYEHWSRDHDIKEGVLTGYVVGRVIGVIGESTVIKPALFRMKEDRRFDDADSHWMYGQLGPMTDRQRRRWHLSAKAKWMPFRLDPETIIANIEETNRLIQEGLEKLRNDHP
jgi:hypothetical protein